MGGDSGVNSALVRTHAAADPKSLCAVLRVLCSNFAAYGSHLPRRHPVASCYDQSYPLGRSCTYQLSPLETARQLLVRSSVVKDSSIKMGTCDPHMWPFSYFSFDILAFRHSTLSVLPWSFSIPSLSSSLRLSPEHANRRPGDAPSF